MDMVCVLVSGRGGSRVVGREVFRNGVDYVIVSSSWVRYHTPSGAKVLLVGQGVDSCIKSRPPNKHPSHRFLLYAPQKGKGDLKRAQDPF